MTDVPTPEEQRRLLATIPGDTGTALRLVSAFADGDRLSARATIAEIAASPRVMFVMSTLAMLASRLAYELTEQVGEDPQMWLHAAAMLVLDEVDQRLKDGRAER